MATVKILYVRNLMLHTTEDTLEACFAKVTGKGTIERVKKIRDYAFIHFNTRDNALKAMRELNNTTIDHAHIEVTSLRACDCLNFRFMFKTVLQCLFTLNSVKKDIAQERQSSFF